VYTAGRLLGGYFGRQIYRRLETLITSLPIFKEVYPYVKQVVDLGYQDTMARADELWVFLRPAHAEPRADQVERQRVGEVPDHVELGGDRQEGDGDRSRFQACDAVVFEWLDGEHDIGVVERVVYLGPTTQVVVRLAGGGTVQMMTASGDADASYAEGSNVTVVLPRDALRVLSD
jgi:hypothetical protein